MKASDITKARDMVSGIRTSLTRAFYPEKTQEDQKTILDELFPPEEVQDTYVISAMKAIPELHAFLRTAWSRARGKEDLILRAAKESAENMRNIVSLHKVVKSTFLDNLDDIDACLETIEALGKKG